MKREALDEFAPVFLVEHYLPGSDLDALRSAVHQLPAAVSRGAGDTNRVRLIATAIVAADESFLCLVEAPSITEVREAYERAGIGIDRLSAALLATRFASTRARRPQGRTT